MQVFKCFFKILRSNIGLIIMYMCIFLGITITMSAVEQNKQAASFNDVNIKLAIIDRDTSEASAKLSEYMLENNTEVKLKDEKNVLQDAVYSDDAEYVLIINKGYESALKKGQMPTLESLALPVSETAFYMDNKVNGFNNKLAAFMAAGMETNEAIKAANTALANTAKAEIYGPDKGYNLQAVSRIITFYRYLSFAYIMMMIFGISTVLLVFGRKEVVDRMNSSALPLKSKNKQLLLGAAVYALLVFVVCTLVGVILYGANMFSAPALTMLLLSFILLLFCLALGFFVSQVSKNNAMVSAIGNILGLGLCFLGGVYVKPEFMGKTMFEFSKFMPTYWYVNGIEQAAVLQGGTQALKEVMPNMIVLLLYAVAMCALGLVVSKIAVRKK